MAVVPTTAYSQAEDAFTLSRALMNDSSGAVFTDALLMPLLNSAYRGLQRELAENGVSVLDEQQDIDLEPDPSRGVTNMEIRHLQPAASLRLPDAADALGTRHRKHRGHIRANGKIHERRRNAKFAAEHLSAAVRMARG